MRSVLEGVSRNECVRVCCDSVSVCVCVCVCVCVWCGVFVVWLYIYGIVRRGGGGRVHAVSCVCVPLYTV